MNKCYVLGTSLSLFTKTESSKPNPYVTWQQRLLLSNFIVTHFKNLNRELCGLHCVFILTSESYFHFITVCHVTGYFKV
jgi:hypothetical protein